MSTRSQNISNLTVDQHDDDLSVYSEYTVASSSSDLKARSNLLTTKKHNYRQPRIPRSMSSDCTPFLATMATAQDDEASKCGSRSHITRRAKSLKGMRSQRGGLIEGRRRPTGVCELAEGANTENQ